MILVRLLYIFAFIIPIKKVKIYCSKILYNEIKYKVKYFKIRNKVIKNLIDIGENSFIQDGVTIKNYEKIVIGNNTSINQNCYLSARGGIKIGNNVRIAHGCSIHTTQHIYKKSSDNKVDNSSLICKEIKIGDNVWLGCNVIILPGVEIGNSSIIGAGSVVTKKIPKNSVAVGVPAEILKENKF